MLAPDSMNKKAQPIAIVGAGDLVSHLHRDEHSTASYHFSIFRFSRDLEVTHGLRGCDLRDIVRLCQVLAFTMADDGWLRPEARKALFDLADGLDQLTQQWSTTIDG